MRKASVLVVDDEKDMTDLLSMLMEKSGHQPLTAHCGTDALEIVGREDPDVMLLDIKMLGMGGMEVLRRAQKIAEGFGVFFLFV